MRSHGTRRTEILLLALVVLLGIDVLSRIPEAAHAEQPQQSQNRLLGFAASPSKSGSNVVIWRQWSNGVIDKRLYANASNISYQDGWVIVERSD